MKGIKHQVNLPKMAFIIKESFHGIIKKRPDNRRMHIILLCCIMICLVMGVAGKLNSYNIKDNMYGKLMLSISNNNVYFMLYKILSSNVE